jgi:hypothetical protein
MRADKNPVASNSAKRFAAASARVRSMTRSWIAGAPALVLGAVCACSGPIDANEATSTTHEAIYGGSPDNDTHANNAVVSLKIGEGTTFVLCSGALIAPNVVLTARHCVSVNITNSIACDSNGVSGNGDQMGADQTPSGIHIFVGPTPNFVGTPAANGKAIFHPQGSIVCNSDMALLVLDQNITSIAPLRIRMNKPVNAGEMVRSVGYGQNDEQLPIGTRIRKDNVGILAVGKTISTNSTALATNEFEVGLSICQGDSGGPAISETTGAVIGVVSRGANCTDNFGHVYTSLSGFGSVIQAAFAVAGGSATDEDSPPPQPATDAGTGGGGGGGGGGGNETPPGGNTRPRLNAGAGNNCAMGGSRDVGVFGVGVLAAIAAIVVRRRRQ